MFIGLHKYLGIFMTFLPTFRHLKRHGLAQNKYLIGKKSLPAESNEILSRWRSFLPTNCFMHTYFTQWCSLYGTPTPNVEICTHFFFNKNTINFAEPQYVRKQMENYIYSYIISLSYILILFLIFKLFWTSIFL